jgi:alpha-maltose-1-phosphate synthase
MRVLFINENLGGHITVHQQLQTALHTHHPELSTEFLHVPPPWLLRRMVGAQVPGLRRLDLDLQPLRAQLALSAWVRRRLRPRLAHFDVVHIYTENAALLSTDLLTGVPTVIGIDNTNALNAYRLPYRVPTRWTPHALKLAQAFERRVYAVADAIIAKSQWAAASLRDDYGITDERVRIIPPAITPPSLHPPAAPGTGPHPMPRIVFVGTSLARKGGQQLLRVHQEFFADRCELVLVTLERIPPARNVTVINDIRPGDGRLLALLRSCAIFAFPSGIDAFSMAVLEAMAAGLPVVACPVGGVAEIVIDGLTGRLVPVGDDAALAAALHELLNDPDKRADMGMAGHHRVQACFNTSQEAAQLVEVLQQAIARHRARQETSRNRKTPLTHRAAPLPIPSDSDRRAPW